MIDAGKPDAMDTQKVVCPCCGRVFPTDKGGIKYCPTCIRYCDADGCYLSKEKPKSTSPYILREGDKPGIAIYTRCEDPLFARAELLVTMDRMHSQDRNKICFGFYDDDPTFTIEEFLLPYVKERRMHILLEKIRQLRANGWKYKRNIGTTEEIKAS